MKTTIDRRGFLRVAGASFGAGALFRFAPLAGTSAEAKALFHRIGRKSGETPSAFSFVQLSDTHVGFAGPPNPLGTRAFERAVERINALHPAPDLVLFTGDLTHDSEKAGERADRMRLFQQIAGRIRAPMVRYVPGEHDAALDGGALFRDALGETHGSFDHRGVHFVALDNVSLGRPNVGPEQLAWLTKDLDRYPRSSPIVVFTHRPLFDLRPDWEWFTGDGDRVMNLLAPFENVTVLYGHIHRHHEHAEGSARHYAARSLVFAFPDPGSGQPKKPLPFDPAKPFANLGLRSVTSGPSHERPRIEEIELTVREYGGTAGIQQLTKGGDLS